MRTHIADSSSRAFRIVVAALLTSAALLLIPVKASANVIFVSGNLRTDANVTACGNGCTLGPSNSDGDYAQWAAVVTSFNVVTTTTMEAITYSYGGGTSLTGTPVSAGGLEPYLSLFDAGGNFLASTLFGTNCPPGANSVGGNCFDVALDGGTLTPGTYEIALTAYSNQSAAENPGGGLGLSDGFNGLGNLGPGENLNYGFDIILAQNVPEPSSLLFGAVGCGCIFLRKRVSRRYFFIRRRRPERTMGFHPTGGFGT